MSWTKGKQGYRFEHSSQELNEFLKGLEGGLKEEEAKYLFASRAAWKIGRNFGQLGPITDPDNAINIIHENNWQEQYEFMFENSIVGEISKTKEKIMELVDDNNIDEIAILTWCHNEEARIQSYELFANEFNLNVKKTLQKTC